MNATTTATREVPADRTPTSVPELAKATAARLEAKLGKAPAHKTLVLLLAHWMLECGWARQCWNWNLGNVKCDGSHPFCFRACGEDVTLETWHALQKEPLADRL